MDNVLNPELMWIGSRCYRVNVPNADRKNEERVRASYEEEEDDFNCELDIDENFYEISVENGKFQLLAHVPQKFHSQIIGAKGSTKKRLETETSTQIVVPKIGVKDTNVIIKGTTKKNVISAKNRLDLIVIAGRSKMQFTHFLSIPFVSDEIRRNFTKFKDQVLNDSEIFGVDESLFQNSLKLHMTISTLALLDNEDRAVAAEFLQDCNEMIIDPIMEESGPLKVKLAGLDYMNDDPSAVDVLYAKVVSSELQHIANGIADYFVDRGFTQQQNENVKLHVTLINSLFRDNDDAIVKDSGQEQRVKRETFDATKILQKYKDVFFGNIIITEIHLSQRFSKGSNGYYEATGILKLK